MKLEISDRQFGGYIFDCDGTIADTMPLHFVAWTKAMKDLGGVFPEDLFYSLGGTPATVIVGMLNQKYGLAMDPSKTVRCKEDYYLQMIPEVKPIEPVLAIARKMHGLVPLAIASGGHREIVIATLRALRIESLFTAIVCAEDYVNGKPSPDPFLKAAMLMGVAADACVVFEDTAIGIEAAKAAGMDWVLVPSVAEHVLPLPEKIINIPT
ncbi:HAD family phosphatase [bacterium]|nr:HAD family phosphatase [bacterium]NBS52516.1 HAD family phosphatase [Spartobacteria bacterium]